MSDKSEFTSSLLAILADNFFYVALMVTILVIVIIFLVIFKQPLTRYLDRTNNISYENGVLKVEASVSKAKEDLSEETSSAPTKEQNHFESEAQDDEGWISAALPALEDGDTSKAEEVFKRWELRAEDPDEAYRDRSFFYYLQFDVAHSFEAISLLEQHLKKADSDSQKMYTLQWLSSALVREKLFDKALDMWVTAINELTEESVLFEAKLRLAKVNIEYELLEQGKGILVSLLKDASNNSQLNKVYLALADVEEKLGNKKISAYCLDKATEYSPQDTDDLFTSAYNASNVGVVELAISNYIRLTQRNPKHAVAWNNLGVVARNSDCHIKAMSSYSKSSELKDTLAMANQGYALLGAGFSEEARKIAMQATKLEDVHPNVYKLIADIESREQKDAEKWDEIVKNASRKQLHYRKYIEHYYKEDSPSIVGGWASEDNQDIQIPNSSTFEVAWVVGDAIKTKHKITGQIKGASFSGRYTKNHSGNNSILGALKDIDMNCLGYVEKDKLYIFSTSAGDETMLTFKRSNS
ncbi:tetratricopeptide repeat protein [Vibrio parahaemolyticus]|uniref:tetratricopeptide repeat protein n=1 Tax=Vibrio parahaemolyticus TaxID=670 RepID=UPI0005442F8C|nr:tetratricopeptide repeat protein [Vibrio parahaemolyticus]EHR6472077.1 tetratricopeptide repeat protein [Vibrio parahaemolyticus]KHF15998.1 hypothetical protein PO81_21735 [Vibrio parahaemolyticus]